VRPSSFYVENTRDLLKLRACLHQSGGIAGDVERSGIGS
jgi:hypothetical protein